MPFVRRAAAGPSPVVQARVAALFGLGGAAPPGAPVPGPAVATVPEPSVLPERLEPLEPPEPLAVGGAPAPPGAPAAGDPAAALPAGDLGYLRLPRLDPGPRGAAALVALAVAAVAVTGFVVWRGRPRPVDVAPPALVVSAPPTPAAVVVVDVAGDVRRPGLVRLPAGARVADALAAAGGLRAGATTAGLNLARKVVDGEQVLVGAPVAPPGGPPGAAAPAAPAPGGLVNLNTATAEQLDGLPGIGPVLADRIVAWRTANGPFASVDQLREVSGIGARKFESIRAHVTV